MEYRKFHDTYYLCCDKGEEVIACILQLCEAEGIASAIYTGIGGCSSAEIQTFIPEQGSFETETVEGMLELVSLTGNIIAGEDGQPYHHTHACFAYKDGEGHCVRAGHIKSTVVLYTAEIELRPVIDGVIKRKFDPETGTGFWAFD